MNRKIISLLILVLPAFAFAQQTSEVDKAKTETIEEKDSTAREAQPEEDVPAVELSESDLNDLQTPQLAVANARDIFYSGASFNFSSARFRMRGYQNQNFSTTLNGTPLNDLENGRTSWGQWGGLNDVFRNREMSRGVQANTFAYGEPGGAYNIKTYAASQRKQFSVSYANTNRSYKHRVMATYSTGMMKSGWAVSASVSRRWADEGYVPGTFYDGTSYFLAVDKRINSNHTLSLTAFGSAVRDGKATAATQEMYNLAGTNYYNSNWGWQDGKKRNAVVGNVLQPMFVLTHNWNINKHENLTTSAGFTFGKNERTGIDFYNSAIPTPDYYRYLPSYLEDSTQQILAANAFRTNPNLLQINWAGLYEANAMNFDSVDNVNGVSGNKVIGKRASYILESTVSDTKKFNLGSTYNNNINKNIAVTAGITYQFQQTENYKKVADLLGADFYVDVNQFAERDFPDSFNVAQNDINHPNRILQVGDKYGYDYFITNHKASTWAQGIFKYNKVDFFIAGDLSVSGYWRTGKTRYGLFPNNSEGKSAVKIFVNGGAKAGVSYKIDGRNVLYLNAGFENRAPLSQDAFISARTQNSFVANLKSENIYSAELGYMLRTAYFNLKADMFFTQFQNQTQLRRFYHADYRTFVNYSLTGIDTRHWGAELGLEAKIWRGFSANAVVSMGRYTYTNRPEATITFDNNPALSSTEKVYSKNFNVGGTPQLATTFGIRYRAPQFWYANVNFNYFDWMWANYNPARRTEAGVDVVDPNSANFANIINQERLKGQFTMNISVGYSWLINNQFKNLKKRYFLVFNAGVNNVTNNKNLVTSANEQLRYDYFEKNPNKFPTKYSYGYGATYNVSVTFRMQ